MNEQIHYTGQYLANKSVYGQFLKSRDKGQFRQEHASEITLYETAAKFLKAKSAKDAQGDKVPGKLPSLKLLKEEKEKLMKKKESEQKAYRQDHDRQKELNVKLIIGLKNAANNDAVSAKALTELIRIGIIYLKFFHNRIRHLAACLYDETIRK